MKQDIKRKLVHDYRSYSGRDLLDKDLGVIDGVDDTTIEALAQMQIFTVFDLATSPVFNAARDIAAENGNKKTPVSFRGKAASHMVKSTSRDKEVEDLKDDSIENLDGIGESLGDMVRDSTEIATIRDMANWPIFETARDILNDALGNNADFNDDDFFMPEHGSDDPDAPRELLPRMGEYPIEKTHYNRIYLDKVESTKDHLDVISGPIDILDKDLNTGFQLPATGALLTYEQSWYGEGLALGQLLHSLALAPAESTRVAVIDWSRKSSTRVDESISQQEMLDNQLTQKRSVYEIMSGVTQEFQSGESTVTSTSNAWSEGKSSGWLTSPFSSESGGESGNSSNVISVSSSEGKRDVSAEATQEIVASTHQHAASARNRRASIVRDASQEEHEEVTTRMITNYNHSHAMSVHYYEVVQIYKTVTRLARAERCLFVPMKIINFRNEKVIDRYRQDLINASLNEITTDLLRQASGKVLLRLVATSNSPLAARQWSVDADKHFDGIRVEHGWGAINKIIIHLKEGSTEDKIEVAVGDSTFCEITGLPKVVDIKKIEVEFEVGEEEIRQMPVSLFFEFKSDTKRRGFRVRFDLDAFRPGLHTLEIIEAKPRVENRQLSELLEEESLYYSQAVWLSLKQHEIAMLLANRSYNNKRIIEYIDPLPLTVYGNYLVFRYNFGTDPHVEKDTKWEAWKAKHANFQHTRQEYIPTPTGGVFGEAVLGRFNASEKLDITRFWNWQDSPIPDTAPEIVPITTGGRGQEDTIVPGNLDAPVVSIQNASSLPDPQGIAALTQALTAANIFRDMSGLTNSQQLAAQTAGYATHGAISAQQSAVDLQKSQMNAIARVIEAAITGQVSSKKGAGVGSGNLSSDGAWINQGKMMDQRSESSSSRDTPSSSDHSGGDSSTNASGSSVGPREESAYKKGVDPLGELMKEYQKDLTGAVAQAGSGPVPLVENRTVIPYLIIYDVGLASTEEESLQLAQSYLYQHQLINANLQGASSILEFVEILQRYSHIGALYILAHGAPGLMAFGNDATELKDITVENPPTIWRIYIEGCNVGNKPTQMVQFGTQFNAQWVYGWNVYKVWDSLGIPLPSPENLGLTDAEFSNLRSNKNAFRDKIREYIDPIITPFRNYIIGTSNETIINKIIEIDVLKTAQEDSFIPIFPPVKENEQGLYYHISLEYLSPYADTGLSAMNPDDLDFDNRMFGVISQAEVVGLPVKLENITREGVMRESEVYEAETGNYPTYKHRKIVVFIPPETSQDGE